KAKIGKGDLATDLARLTELRAALGSSVAIRLDANGAWSSAHARDNLGRLASVRPELVEEPSHGESLLALGACAVPWFADESVALFAERLLDDTSCAGIILKPTCLGGLFRSRDL